MINKPKCTTDGCNNNAELSKRTILKDYYAKLCSSHKRKKYGMPSKYKKDKIAWRKFKKDTCSNCGWKGPCDAHRIIHGSQGGRYVKGNILEICPNCHRLHHRGIIKLPNK